MEFSKIENGRSSLDQSTEKAEKTKTYDLEERTALFAIRVRDLCLKLPKNLANIEYIPQLVRAGSSAGANYIVANEAIGDKDFGMKIKTCRRESKESGYWLRLAITDGSKESEEERAQLRQEAKELVLIFTAILKNRASNRHDDFDLNFKVYLVLVSWLLVLT